jgi:hypothetical protein
MSTNICEILHKTNLKPCGKRTNQQSDMCKQVMHRSVEGKIASDACVASDMYHGLEDEEYLWGDLCSTR